jgi:DUF4097 and DUF4098 domain-containing protein YvlB
LPRSLYDRSCALPSSGNISVSDAKATEFHVETGSGDVDATGAAGDDLSFETGSGNVRLVKL